MWTQGFYCNEERRVLYHSQYAQCHEAECRRTKFSGQTMGMNVQDSESEWKIPLYPIFISYQREDPQ